MKNLPPSLITALLLLVTVIPARAEVRMEAVQYKHGEVELEGFFAWDDRIKGRRPGVLVIHEWWGLNDYVKQRARKLAKLGYVAFAAGMYGRGKLTRDPSQARLWSSALYGDVRTWRERARIALDVLAGHGLVDSAKKAAIGYCFGGSTVMQMTYVGADLAGVVSFHGSLPVPTSEEAKNIKSKILIAHGNADPFIPQERILKFKNALEHAGVDWQMVYYAGAKHAFTNPDADAYGVDGVSYNKNADLRSWVLMRQFLDELFAPGG